MTTIISHTMSQHVKHQWPITDSTNLKYTILTTCLTAGSTTCVQWCVWCKQYKLQHQFTDGWPNLHITCSAYELLANCEPSHNITITNYGTNDGQNHWWVSTLLHIQCCLRPCMKETDFKGSAHEWHHNWKVFLNCGLTAQESFTKSHHGTNRIIVPQLFITSQLALRAKL